MTDTSKESPTEDGPHGRILQHSSVESDLVRGQRVLEAFSMSTVGRAREPLLVLLKTERPYWHRFFLDAGFVAWEEWAHDDAFDGEPDEYFDIGDSLHLRGRVLGSILAFPEVPDGGPALHLHLSDSERLVLFPSDPHELDSPSLLRVEAGTEPDTLRSLLGVYDQGLRRRAPPARADRHLVEPLLRRPVNAEHLPSGSQRNPAYPQG